MNSIVHSSSLMVNRHSTFCRRSYFRFEISIDIRELLAGSWATFRLIYDRYKFCGALRVHAISARQQLICLLAVCVASKPGSSNFSFSPKPSKFRIIIKITISLINFSFYRERKNRVIFISIRDGMTKCSLTRFFFTLFHYYRFPKLKHCFAEGERDV